ncbi:MAG: tetratricopeptide repeat protein [Isosphaeraceae bacterium]
MIRPIRFGAGWLVLSVVLTTWQIGCDYSRSRNAALPSTPVLKPRQSPAISVRTKAEPTKTLRDPAERAAILKSSIELIQRAALQPGGDNFGLATQKLNQYFEGIPSSEYQLESATKAYIDSQVPPGTLGNRVLAAELENPKWTNRDARHLEDCMLYSAIAGRIAGTGDDLTRVGRVFDWVTRQIQLVPAGSLGTRQLPHVPSRPYDVLLRGVATESEGYWAERSWLFISLCRQLGIDVGILTYTKGNVVEPLVAPTPAQGEAAAGVLKPARPARIAIPWVCAALIEGKAYLFDPRIGWPIYASDGKTVATLDQAMADPAILERMNLPGQSPYGTSRASLLSSATRIGVLIDSSPGYFSPRMRLLQRELSGKNRTILHRDPVEQRDHFAQVLKDHCGEVRLWGLPLDVESRLFGDSQFVQSTQQTLFLFRPEFPLVFARIKQLRGDLDAAVQEFVSFRLAENVPVVGNKKQTIPREIQRGLDIYATLYLAMAHLERDRPEQAENMFLRLLEMLPEPGANQPYLFMFRWGAHTNLGRIYEARGDRRAAIAQYAQADATMQHHGNLLRARDLVWDDPMARPPDPLPEAPKTL